MATEYRVGIGHDTHRLVTGRPLILGGVEVAFDRGLFGHSDADVVLHALTDDAFPDDDPRWSGMDSRLFVQEVCRRLRQLHWRVVNCDVIVFAQQPKLGPVKSAIRQRIAELLGVSAEAVNVKAKTGEGVGHIGRGEAIAAQAVVLLARTSSPGTTTPP